MDLIHVKDSARRVLPSCGFDPKDEPLAWTTFESARVMATCAECLADVLRDECSVCDGSGIIPDSYDKMRCLACHDDEAQAIIDARKVK